MIPIGITKKISVPKTPYGISPAPVPSPISQCLFQKPMTSLCCHNDWKFSRIFLGKAADNQAASIPWIKAHAPADSRREGRHPSQYSIDFSPSSFLNNLPGRTLENDS